MKVTLGSRDAPKCCSIYSGSMFLLTVILCQLEYKKHSTLPPSVSGKPKLKFMPMHTVLASNEAKFCIQAYQ